jgi:hypothetical protein
MFYSCAVFEETVRSPAFIHFEDLVRAGEGELERE